MAKTGILGVSLGLQDLDKGDQCLVRPETSLNVKAKYKDHMISLNKFIPHPIDPLEAFLQQL